METIFRILRDNLNVKKNIWLEPVDDSFNERDFRIGQIAPNNEVEYTISRGKVFTDVLGNTYGGILFSKRLIDILRKNNVKGLDIYPAKIRLKKRGNEFNCEYFLVRSNEFCGDPDYSVSEIETSDHGPEYDSYVGYKLDLSSIDQSSGFFSTAGAGQLHCSEGVVRLIQSEEVPIEGIGFENISAVKASCKWTK